MLFPGIKKVRDHFNFTDDGNFVNGVLKNSRIRLCDGHNCKILYITAPAEISESTRQALLEFSKKPYNAKLQINTQSVSFTFREIFAPYSWKKICQIIEKAADIFYSANPDLTAPDVEDSGQVTAINSKSVNIGSMFIKFGIIAAAFIGPFIFKELKAIDFAAEYAKTVSAECPVQIDEYTRLDSASSSWHKVFLNYTFTTDDEVTEDLPENIKQNFIDNLKVNNWDSYFYERTTWFMLNYFDLDGNQLFQVKIVPIDYKPEGVK